MCILTVYPHVLLAVTMNDRGLYSCNLHHHYCHLYETIRVQLNVTKSRMSSTASDARKRFMMPPPKSEVMINV